ncbi:MAG: NUDIX domain-containing protein, partial [Chloroflexi bacterium]|nr:NUDIX domain-containing protein [Chloroflexota bacterium]
MSYIEWIRSCVGNRKIFLVFATVIVRDENGRFLLQRRTDFDFWGLPGGVLEIDEDIETCARRELKEETGLTVGDLTLTGIYTHPRYDVVYPNGDQVQQFTACFMGRMNGGVMQVDGVETSHQQFFAAEELSQLHLPLWYRDMLMDVQQAE